MRAHARTHGAPSRHSRRTRCRVSQGHVMRAVWRVLSLSLGMLLRRTPTTTRAWAPTTTTTTASPTVRCARRAIARPRSPASRRSAEAGQTRPKARRCTGPRRPRRHRAAAIVPPPSCRRHSAPCPAPRPSARCTCTRVACHPWGMLPPAPPPALTLSCTGVQPHAVVFDGLAPPHGTTARVFRVVGRARS